MRRLAALILPVALLGSSACALHAERGVPEGAEADARFLSLVPDALPTCGATSIAVAPRGQIPAPTSEGGALPILLEIPGSALADRFADADPIPVFAVAQTYAGEHDGTTPLPVPVRGWSYESGHYVPLEAEEVERQAQRLRLLVEPRCLSLAEAWCALEGPGLCDDFEHYDVQIFDSAGGLYLGLPLDEQNVLVARPPLRGGAGATLFIVSQTVTDQLPELPPSAPYAGGFRDDQGVVWLFGPYGRFGRFTRAAGLERLSGAIGAVGFEASVDGSRDGSPFELFVATDAGELLQYREGNWNDVVPPDGGYRPGAAVVWLGPGRAAAVGVRPQRVTIFESTVIRHEDPQVNGELTAIAKSPDGAPVVATEAGELRIRGPEGWQPLEPGPEGNDVRALLAFRGGYLAPWSVQGLGGGWVSQVVPGQTVCESVRVTQANIQRIWPMGEDAVGVIGEDVDYDSWVSIIRRIPPVDPCAQEEPPS